jgi:hypothetical protein
VPWWTAPVILEALIPGSMQSHASTAGVPQGPVVKVNAALLTASVFAVLVRPDPVWMEDEGSGGWLAEHVFLYPAAQFCR